MHARAPESHAQSQDPASLSALPHGIYQPCHSGMVFFPFSVHFHLSPDESFPRFKQRLLCCGRRGGGVRFISVSSPRELCPGRPPCFILLPTELVKINMFSFAYIRLACNLADGGAPRGAAAARIWIRFRKMCLEKKPKPSVHTRGCTRSRASFF